MVNHTNEMCCPNCGIDYRNFRTGFSYADVYAMLWKPSHDSDEWMYKRRNTILGKWHQIKQEMWTHHLENCEENNERSKTQIDRKRHHDY